MKTIGVIGGIGPQATIDFEQHLHAEAQRVLPQHLNTGYPPLLVYYFREPPIAVDQDGSPLAPLRLSPRLLDVATTVGASSDFILRTTARFRFSCVGGTPRANRCGSSSSSSAVKLSE